MAKRPSQESAPVRLYAEEDRRVPRTLKQTLEKEREREADALLRGIATDFADYRFRVGKLQALQNAIKLCQEAMDQASDD